MSLTFCHLATRAFATAVIAATLLAGSSAGAADAPKDAATVVSNARLKSLSNALTLTDEQKEKVRPLLVEEVKFLHGLRENQALTEAERIKQEKEFREAARPKFKAMLSEEQFQKFEQLRNGKGRKPGRPPAPKKPDAQ